MARRQKSDQAKFGLTLFVFYGVALAIFGPIIQRGGVPPVEMREIGDPKEFEACLESFVEPTRSEEQELARFGHCADRTGRPMVGVIWFNGELVRTRM